MLIDTEADCDDIDVNITLGMNGKQKHEANKLDAKTKELVSVIHNKDIVQAQVLQFDLNVLTMPLCAVETVQVERGTVVLNEVKA